MPPRKGRTSEPVGTGMTMPENVCPECGYQFQGNRFDGIDAHWRSKHETVMPYEKAWPLIRSGNYSRKESSEKREIGPEKGR
jgi:hypothetical protein